MRMTISLFVAATLLFSSPLFANDPDAIAKERFENVNSAAKFLQSGKQKEAIESAEKAISSFDAEFSASNQSVFCAEGFNQTLMLVTMAAAGKPDTTALNMTLCDALFIKGFALVDLGRNEEAGVFLKRASETAPLNAHYMNEYAEWFKRNKQWQQSYDQFEAARDLNEFIPDEFKKEFEARSLRGMGFTLIELGKLDEAEKMLKLSLKLIPGHAGAKTELQYIKEQRVKK